MITLVTVNNSTIVGTQYSTHIKVVR
jgi:hypothetical protein